MQDAAQALTDLLEYVQDNRWVCREPTHWDRIWEIFPPEKTDSSDWTPSMPLILFAWRHSGVGWKWQRFAENLQCAHDTENLKVTDRAVKTLSEDE